MRLFWLAISCCLWLGGVVVAQDATVTEDPEPITLTVWWPEPLAQVDSEAAQQIMDQQAAFNAEESLIDVTMRLRRVGDVGGIMATLRTASSVAPGALPDLTLLRRQDVLAAQRDGLIQPMEGLIPTAIVGALDDSLALGQIAGDLYGLPYVVDVLHLVERLPDNPSPDSAGDEAGTLSRWRFEDVLAREQTMIFPAGRVTGFSDVFFLQYLAAGASLPRDGNLTLNEDALATVLNFYEQATAAALIDPAVLTALGPADYRERFLAGGDDSSDAPDMGVFASSDYLAMLAGDVNLRAAPIPTSTGRETSFLNGWVWVIVTSDPERQAAAVRYLAWLMDEERHLAYAQAIHMLPSQRNLLSQALPSSVDETLFQRLLENAILPQTATEGGTLARALQDAFIAVLSGESNAEEALNDVRDSLEG